MKSCLLFLVCLASLAQYGDCKVSQCKLCTSDSDDPNLPCEENPDVTGNGACDPQYGNDYCYVLYTRNKKPIPGESWNSKLIRTQDLRPSLTVSSCRRLLQSKGRDQHLSY